MTSNPGDKDERSGRARQLRQASIALSIPTMMAAGPLVGCGLGWAAQRYLNAPEWAMPVCIALGLAAGIRQTIKLIRRLDR